MTTNIRNKNRKFYTTLEINGVEDVPVIIHYELVPFHRGSTDGRHGPKLEPDEPAHIEIDHVEVPNGWGPNEMYKEITLSQWQERNMEEEIGKHLEGMYDGPPERE